MSKERDKQKEARQEAIARLVQNEPIQTQMELIEHLKQAGFGVTQATVSRDIKDLMLIKIPYKNGHYRYALSNEKQSVMSKSHTAILFQEAVVKIDSAMNMVVLHTIPGSASSVAFAIDHSKNDVIIGTLAGDDTVLIILKTPEDVPVLLSHIQGMLKS